MINKTLLILFFIWLLATVFNLTKALHIDDTAYIEEAIHIAQDPLHPMSGWLNWFDTLEQIRYRYHPLFIPYLYAFVIRIFGISEFGMHLLMSIFTLGSIIFFYLLAKQFVFKYRFIFTAMFILGPSFLPGQNLMLDVPNVAFWLAFFWALLTPYGQSGALKRYVFAALMIGFATMTKYSGFILVPILCLDIILRRRWSLFWVILIPIAIIIGWSLFNYWEYGGIHILGSQNTPISIERIRQWVVLFVVTIGSMSPFTLVLVPFCLFDRRAIILIGSIVFSIFYSQANWIFSGEPTSSYILRLAFLANGIFLISLLLYYFFFIFRRIKSHFSEEKNIPYIILFFWFLGGSIVMSIFVPFMAVRHVLIVIPVVLLILGSVLYVHLSKPVVLFACFLTLFLGIILAISDWITADVYRNYAPRLLQSVKTFQQQKGDFTSIFFAGHWGWQWYARKEGMMQYDTWRSEFLNGDYLVLPSTETQYINPNHQQYLQYITPEEVPHNILTVFRTLTDSLVAPRGYYATGDRFLPWAILTTSLEEFRIYKFTK